MVKEMFDTVDSNGNGTLCRDEFVQFSKYVLAASCSLKVPHCAPVNIEQMFMAFDEDGDGTLTWAETWQAISPLLTLVKKKMFQWKIESKF